MTKLNEQQMKVISQVLFNGRWTGQEWEQQIKPIINTLAKMIDELNSRTPKKEGDKKSK